MLASVTTLDICDAFMFHETFRELMTRLPKLEVLRLHETSLIWRDPSFTGRPMKNELGEYLAEPALRLKTLQVTSRRAASGSSLMPIARALSAGGARALEVIVCSLRLNFGGDKLEFDSLAPPVPRDEFVRWLDGGLLGAIP